MKPLLIINRVLTLSLFALFIVTFSGCDENDPNAVETPNEHVNKWIYENMDFWYYWTAELPAEGDQTGDPEAYFYTLRNTQDRFSWIQPDYQELLNSLRGITKEDGFEYAIYRETPESNTLIMQILYIKPNSPASQAGLKRGDVVTHVNGTQLSISTYESLIGGMGESHSLTYRPIDYEARTLGTAQTVSLVPVEYAENPNHLNKIFTYGDRKIGYYVYNLFAEGPNETSKEYTNEMDNIIASFKGQGVTDVIVDFRFNSGGALSTAQNLASLLGKNIGTSALFSRYEYNATVTAQIKSDPNLGEGFLNTSFLNKTQNVGNQLRDSRIYFLTSGRTASASEMVINSLRPFMDVFLVGGTTLGKNVGSISIYDEEDPENNYGMQPIVTKIYNSASQSDFSNGFVPQIQDADNSLYLYPLGDPRETLLNKALQQITGSGTISRTAESVKAGDVLLHSLDGKRRSGIATIELQAGSF